MPDIAGFDVVTLMVFAALVALSVAATTVTLFKIVQFAMLGLGRRPQALQILAQWQAGKKEAAVAAAMAGKAVQLRVLHAVLAAQSQRSDATDWVEEIGRQAALSELGIMAKWMRTLEAVVQAAPMLGLLGTVVGMIDAFGTLAQSTGGVDPALLAGGIWTALTTTAIGLAIALVFYFVAIWLEGRIDNERQELEALLSAAIHGSVGAVAKAAKG
ncbi:MAG: MotA/TolQ/ExbB proton channel family protein [Pseudorhodobacter sp.]